MTCGDLDLAPAADHAIAELAALWRSAYADYPVNVAFSPDQLSRHIRVSGIDLTLSLVARLEGEPIALSLAATAGRRAWIGGFGVVERHRRKGVAGRLMQRQGEVLDSQGHEELALEVLKSNPARRLYERAGFRVARRLVTFDAMTLRGRPACLDELPRDRLAGVMADLKKSGEESTWRRQTDPLMRAMEPGGEIVVWPDAKHPRCCAVVRPGAARVEILDIAASDQQAAEVLTEALIARARGRWLRLVDEPVASLIATTFRRFGAHPRWMQFEMRRPQPASERIAA